jgi:type IV secretory pathway TrbD component
MSLSDLFRQLSLLIGLPAVVLAGIGAAIVIIVRDWRAVLFGYALMSVMLALLLSRLIPPSGPCSRR